MQWVNKIEKERYSVSPLIKTVGCVWAKDSDRYDSDSADAPLQTISPDTKWNHGSGSRHYNHFNLHNHP